MKSIINKGENNSVFITLHGTGGEADQLFDVARMIDPKAHLIGIQGSVKEQGMNRYFERFPDGTYNYDSLDANSDSLFEAIKTLISENNYDDFDIYIMGYSNGANMITNMMRRFKLDVKGVLIFHPAIMRMQLPYLNQENLKAFISTGVQDPYFSPEAMESMSHSMNLAGVSVKSYVQNLGHQLTHDEIEAAKGWYNDGV